MRYFKLSGLILFLFACFHVTAQDYPVIKQELNTGWQFRQNNIGKWLPATVPGTVHTDLLSHKLIKDPYYRTNEQEVQWVDKVNWEYSLTFRPEDAVWNSTHQQLTFHGLDTWTDIFLNGEKIASTDNMFRTWKIDVKGKLKEGDNVLNIRFYSPITKGLEKMEEYGLALPADNDYSQYGGMGKVRVSVYMRKAPYHFGWDWGPRLVPSGIWKPIVLEGWNDIRIEDIYIRQPSVTASLAKLEASVTFISDNKAGMDIEISSNGKILKTYPAATEAGINKIDIPFSIKNPKLWWSNGIGEPHLYTFDIKIKKAGKVIASHSVTTGIRSIRLIREKDEHGESFYFELNGRPVFAKGTNSIPNDIFLPRITRQDYEKMVLDVANANMNMIRIWGGGIYEDDYFYELCDKHGIMVWQDFSFACAMYPGNEEYMENIRLEAIDNIIRIRNHPSLALWCGNNEVDVAWARWGWKKRYTEEEQKRIFDAYIQQAHVLPPELVAEYSDGIDYWPSSPMSGPEVNAHELRPATSGDNHYWGVWFEKHTFEDFEKNIGRFISEYGFQSFPEMSTIETFTTPEDYDINSEVMKAHQRSFIGNERIREYMSIYYRVPEDFEQFIYMSQVLQAKGMKKGLQAHRRNMPYCMGSLMWQLNDVWPAASWSTVDYFHNWKAAHYASRDACKPVVMIPRMVNEELELWYVNDLRSDLNLNYTMELRDFEGNLLNMQKGKFKGKSNVSEKIEIVSIPSLLQGQPKENVFATIRLFNGKKILDEQNHYFTEFKNLNLPTDPKIRIEKLNKNGKNYIRFSAKKLACDVMFYSPGKTLHFTDNYIDLLPGKVYEIEYTGGDRETEIKVRFVQ